MTVPTTCPYRLCAAYVYSVLHNFTDLSKKAHGHMSNINPVSSDCACEDVCAA